MRSALLVVGAAALLRSGAGEQVQDEHAQDVNQFRFWRDAAEEARERARQPESAELPSKAAEETSDQSVCDPECVEGQGHCHDNICWCKHPWTGSKCDKELKIRPRLGYSLSFGLLGVAIVAGVIAAVIICEILSMMQTSDYGTVKLRREQWSPATRA